jgi:hypothetical protein
MNQILRKSLLFAFASLLGGSIFIPWPTADLSTAEAQTVQFSNSNAAPPREPFKDDFSPEFRDLPTFDEVPDSAVADVANLIDIAEFHAPDDTWPSYSKNELAVRSGESWLGLYELDGELFLADTKVTRSTRRGYIGPGDQPYDWLGYERKGNLFFLVKGIPALKPCKVTTLYWKQNSNDNVSLDVGFRRSFQLFDRAYTLRVTSGIQRDGEKVNVLILESEGKSQIITFNHYYKDHNTLYNSVGELLWIGDMDGDGRLDLYFSDYGYEKGGFGSNLFLSSPADQGTLVKQVAGFGTSGC